MVFGAPNPARSETLSSMGGRVAKSLLHKTISGATAAELRQRILNGALPAGIALRQTALAEEFGISRIPLREALLQLEAEGLVKIVPHRGAIVSEISSADVTEVFELRLLLEPRLLKWSAPNLRPQNYARLRAILAEYGAELRSDNASRWGELNTAFHSELYSQAGRPRSLAVVANLMQESDRLTRMQLTFTDGRERAEIEHAALVDLCEAGEVQKAAALLRSHIENVHKTLQAFLGSHRPAAADVEPAHAHRSTDNKGITR
jgi:DNA-binding GntR family transcriptional regulator